MFYVRVSIRPCASSDSGVYVNIGFLLIDFGFDTIAYRSLVSFELDKEIAFSFLDLVDNIFLERHSVSCNYFSGYVDFSQSVSEVRPLPLLFPSQASVANMIQEAGEYAETISGLRPFC